jgi:hypothetical protein
VLEGGVDVALGDRARSERRVGRRRRLLRRRGAAAKDDEGDRERTAAGGTTGLHHGGLEMYDAIYVAQIGTPSGG